MATKRIMLPINGGISHSTSPAGVSVSGSFFKRLFDAATAERHRWQFGVPSDFTGSPRCFPTFSMASATSGSVVLSARLISVGSGININAATFDNANNLTVGVPTTACRILRPQIDLTSSCSMAACDLALFEFFRDGGNAADTASGDLELVAMMFTYS